MNRTVSYASVCAAVLLTLLGVDRYVTYHSGADLGVFVQAIANAAHGMADTPEGGSHFLHHFSPILYLFAPLLWITHSAIALIAVQAVAYALVAPALFAFARRHMDERLAATASIVALAYPPLVGVAFTDFHELGFAPAAFVGLVWAVDARRWIWASVWLAVMLSIKEDQALILASLGVLLAVAAWRRDPAAARFGALASLVSLATFVGYFAIVWPLAGGSGNWFALSYYLNPPSAGTHHGFAAVLARLSYLGEALVPLLFIPLRTPWFVLAVPGLFEVLASRWSITYTMGQHYAGVWIGGMLIAYVMGLATIAQTDAKRATNMLRATLGICILVLVFASPTHWGHYLRLRGAHDAALDRIVARVPGTAPIGTFDEAYVHLAFDPNAQMGFEGEPEYALVDAHYNSAAWRDVYGPQFNAISGAYRPVATDDGVTLYQRTQGRPR